MMTDHHALFCLCALLCAEPYTGDVRARLATRWCSRLGSRPPGMRKKFETMAFVAAFIVAFLLVFKLFL